MTTKKTYGNRKFYSLPEEYPLRLSKTRTSTHGAKKSEDTNKLIRYIDDSVIGKTTTFSGPYGRRKVVYCDYAASGRSLQFIEDYILREVLPCYGNTHTTTSITSLQSTLFRHEARDIFRNAVNASEHDAVIFAGHGCTGAVHKLIHALDLSEPPVVFVGPCEHHSNLLPWREKGAEIARISETKEGFLDLEDLEAQLQQHQGSSRRLIGCFSAASNITGILADDVAITILLHQYGALAFWDYAASAPYVKLDMNPFVPGVEEKAVYKDAIFFSVHKFIGGVQTPGVLVAKKALFNNLVPNGCGGGTVFFVTRDSHRYLQDTELREEGGTAAVVESVRAGLVMQLKETVGVAAILSREEKISRMVLSHMRTIPELTLLGNGSGSVKRLPVFSFMVRHPRGTFLHHNFVCAVLNDVFGVQARGGCACAGPYAQDLLGIDDDLAAEYETVLLEDGRLDRSHLRRHKEHSSFEMLRPGFSRISLPYFMSDLEVAFVLEALKMVATEGWKLLPQYILNPETGEWRHHTNSVFRDRKWLGSIRYTDGKMSVNERRVSGLGMFPPQDNADCLHTARSIFNKARKMAQRFPLADQCVMFDSQTDHLRWFMLPSEAQDLLLGNSRKVKHSVPFDPASYCGSKGSVADLHRHNSLPCMVDESPRETDRHKMRLHAVVSPRTRCHSLGSPIALLPRGQGLQRHSETDLRPNPPSPLGLYASPPSPLSLHACSGLGDRASTIPNQRPNPPSPLGLHACSSPVPVPCSGLGDRASTIPNLRLDGLRHTTSNGLDSPPCTRVTAKLSSSTGTLGRKPPPPCTRVISRSEPLAKSLMVAIPCTNLAIERHSCSSQTDLRFLGLDSSPPSPEGIQAYVEEVTKELATEIKSEIREVISKVEDVLTDSSGGERDRLGGSVSARDVAQYLVGVSREMASEVKTEIRGLVDDIMMERTQSSECSSDETVIHIVEGAHRARQLRSTIDSISSQDSGINLSFQEPDDPPGRMVLEGMKLGFPESKPSTDDRLSRSELEVPIQDPVVGDGARWHCPPKAIWKPAVEALHQFDMIRDGDRVMVCLSGGKDSLSLLHTLHQYQFYSRAKGISFTLGAATVDPGSTAYDPRPLIPYLEGLGVHYLYEEQPILEQAAALENCTSVCSFCSRMKRGRLYAAARGHGYNVLALGQHLDDLAESFLMSTFHNGRLRSMKAHYYIRERDLRVIRPFVYVREKALRQFAESRNLPIIPENCPACFEAPKERHRSKQLLAQQEILFPKLFWSLRSALLPLISHRHTGDESRAYNRHRKHSHHHHPPQPSPEGTDTDEEPVS